MNKDFVLIGIAVIGSITFGVDYFLLDMIVDRDISEVKNNA